MHPNADGPGMTALLAGARRAMRRCARRSRQRGDSEAEQALIRLVLSGLAALYVLTADLHRPHHGDTETLIASVATVQTVIWTGAGILIFMALLLLAAALWSTRPSPVRRCVGIVVDLSATSTAIAFAGEAGAPLLAVYLWVIVGNGFRYGVHYLAFATGLSLVGLGVATAVSPFWRSHFLFSASFLLVLVLIPGYVAALLRKLRRAMRQADEANQAKSQFLAKMSHELRTPLNGIIGISDLLQDGELPERERELVQTIHSSGETLLGIIDGILDFSRIEAGHVRIESVAFSPQRLLADTMAMFEPQAQRKGLGLTHQIDPSLPTHLIGDPLHIRQVLMNLIANALKFTDAGAVRVRVAVWPGPGAGAGPESGPGAAWGASQVPGTPPRRWPDRDDPDWAWVRFEVADTGSGISAAEQARIFERFHQTESSAARALGGVGLGTAIARELVQQMGGRIGLHSAPGQGSLFWFELPLERTEVPARASAGAPVGAPVGVEAGGSLGDAGPHDSRVGAERAGRVLSLAAYYRRIADADSGALHILVAEDNATNRRVLCSVLHQAGHRVTVVEDGDAALDVLQDPAARLDLLILDRAMPGRDGLEVFRAQRFLRPSQPIPTIILSADATEQAQRECREAGVDAYLTKPIASRALLETIARLAPKRPPTVASAPGAGAGQGVGRDAEAGPLVDNEQVQALRQLGAGAEDHFFDTLVAGFCRDAERAVATIAEALAAEDFPALRGALHALEGSAGEVGAIGVVAAAKRFRALKPFDLGSARPRALLQQLRATLVSTSQLLLDERAATKLEGTRWPLKAQLKAVSPGVTPGDGPCG